MTRLHHVQVTVDPGRAEEVVPFYSDLLGLSRAELPADPDRSGADPAVRLHLQDGGQVHLCERVDEHRGGRHFALVVDDFDLVVTRLKAAGAPWDPRPDLAGARRGVTRDPAGNAVEIVEPVAG